MTLLGIDIGSSGVKGARVDLADGSVTSAQAGVELHSPHPGWAEADPGQWWARCRRGRPRAAVAPRASRVEAVGAAGMVPAVLALDDRGRPLRRAILQNDARADAEVEELAEQLAGSRPGRAHRLGAHPAVGRARRCCGCAATSPTLFEGTASLVRAPTTGSRDSSAPGRTSSATGHSRAACSNSKGAPLLEVIARSERRSGAPALGADPGEVVGRRQPRGRGGDRAARRAPRSSSAAPTTCSSAYGAGLLEPGDWLVKLGGAGDILAVSGDAAHRRAALPRCPPGGRAGCRTAAWRPAARSSAGWPRCAAARTWRRSTAEAAATPPGAGGIVCLPYFLGEKSPLHDPDQRGAFVGLHLGHTRGHLYRAALEAVAFGFRHHVEVFNELGVSLSTARVTNGGSRSTLWKQIIADVLGTPLAPVLDHPGAVVRQRRSPPASGWAARLAGRSSPSSPGSARRSNPVPRTASATTSSTGSTGRSSPRYGRSHTGWRPETGASHERHDQFRRAGRRRHRQRLGHRPQRSHGSSAAADTSSWSPISMAKPPPGSPRSSRAGRRRSTSRTLTLSPRSARRSPTGRGGSTSGSRTPGSRTWRRSPR